MLHVPLVHRLVSKISTIVGSPRILILLGLVVCHAALQVVAALVLVRQVLPPEPQRIALSRGGLPLLNVSLAAVVGESAIGVLIVALVMLVIDLNLSLNALRAVALPNVLLLLEVVEGLVVVALHVCMGGAFAREAVVILGELLLL